LIVVAALICAAAAAAIAYVRPALYSATTDLLVDTPSSSAGAFDLTAGSAPANQDAALLESQIFIVQSWDILSRVVGELNLASDPFFNPARVTDQALAEIGAVSILKKNVTIIRQGQSFVISLKAKHPNGDTATRIADIVASVYLKRLHQARSDASVRASGAFELQAAELAKKLRSAEEKLERFKKVNNIVATGPQHNLVIDQQVEGVNQQLIAARADLELKLVNYNQIKELSIGKIEASGIPEALSASSLSVMRARFSDLAARADQLSTTLGESHPQMQAVRSQVMGLQNEIENELSRIRQSMKGGLDRAEAKSNALAGRLRILGSALINGVCQSA
jgi:succinoglycan biosynthesis transport protein ExoP